MASVGPHRFNAYDPLLELGALHPEAPFIEEFAATHAFSYAQGNFASPFLILMTEAARSNKTVIQKKEWVLRIHQGVVGKAEMAPIYRQIALASASDLYDELLQYHAQRYYSYVAFPSLDYNASLPVLPKIDPKSTNRVIHKLVFDYGNDLKAFNAGAFLAYLYRIPSRILWEEYLVSIASDLIEGTLIDVFPDPKNETLIAYRKIAPFVIEALRSAEMEEVHLKPASKKDKECCGCIIL